jgi:DNA-binding GntR family transcriptional regulator
MGPLYRGLERKLEYPKMAAETVREHAAIVSAISRHDPRAARSAMQRHMDQTHNRYIKEWNIGN